MNNFRTIANAHFLETVTPSIRTDQTIQAYGQAIHGELQAAHKIIPNLLIYSNIAEQPEEILDLLAWQWHVDGYEEAGTLEEKIFLIKNFHLFHAYKGTEYAAALYLETFLQRKLLKADPPHRSYCGVSLTDQERQSFMATHPEVRFYPFRKNSIKRTFFVGDPLNAAFPDRTDAILRIGEKVTLFDPLTDQEQEINQLEDIRLQATKSASVKRQVCLPGLAAGLFFSKFISGFTVDQQSRERLFTLELAEEYTDEVSKRRTLSIQPSLKPFRSVYEQTFSRAQAEGCYLRNRWLDLYPDRPTNSIPKLKLR